MKVLKTALFVFLPFISFGQELVNDSTFISSQGQELKIGDDLIIGYPSGSEFIHVSNDTKKKLGIGAKLGSVASSVGHGVVGAGIGSGSVGAIRTGARVAQVGGTASEVAQIGGMVLKGENELTGQKVRILKFEQKGNKKRGEHFYAIVAGEGLSNYKIEIESAIFTKELAGVNNEFFEGFGQQ